MSDLTGTKGGSGVWQRIISEMPEHDVYIEPFWGRGTIAKAKRPAAITIGIDLDPDAISSGRGLALMFLADGLRWIQDYFSPGSVAGSDDAGSGVPVRAATFGGFPFRRHFVYIDPPYLGCHGYYKHELTTEQHVDLCRTFLALPCPAALSGYWSDVHAAELRGCRLVKIPTTNRAGRKVIEHLWLNYDPPLRYHDTRFVGSCRRQRERIRRRVRNWSEGLARMKPAERQAVFEACAASFGGEVLGADSGSDAD